MPETHNRRNVAIRYTDIAMLDPRISGGKLSAHVDYIASDKFVEVMNERCVPYGVQVFEHTEPIEVKEWDRKSSLNGKRCLFISLGGIGDSLSHTALIGHAKRLYPNSEWTVFTTVITNGNAWLRNPNIWGMMPQEFPIPKAVWDSYDYHFTPYGFIAYERGKNQKNFYDILFRWMFGEEVDEKYWQPELYLEEGEEVMTWGKLHPNINWTQINQFPQGHIVIQLNASKEVRNAPIPLLIELLHEIQKRYPEKVVHLYGEGKYAYDFVQEFAKETWYWMVINGQQVSPFFFNIICLTEEDAPYQMQMIPTRLKMQGNLGAAQVGALKNYQLSLRGAACVVRSASVCICPDSAFVHLAAAVRTPTVSLFGAFNPEWRTSTYGKNASIYKPEVCAFAPCSWHEDGYPSECPKGEAQGCLPMEAVTVKDIMEQIEKAMK